MKIRWPWRKKRKSLAAERLERAVIENDREMKQALKDAWRRYYDPTGEQDPFDPMF